MWGRGNNLTRLFALGTRNWLVIQAILVSTGTYNADTFEVPKTIYQFSMDLFVHRDHYTKARILPRKLSCLQCWTTSECNITTNIGLCDSFDSCYLKMDPSKHESWWTFSVECTVALLGQAKQPSGNNFFSGTFCMHMIRGSASTIVSVFSTRWSLQVVRWKKNIRCTWMSQEVSKMLVSGL